MSVLEITKMGNLVLRKIAAQVDQDEILTKPFQDLIDQMALTMEEVGGIGIAAPQVGISKQLASYQSPIRELTLP